jgi:predicted DNA-binding transcriptional regulator AlpA
MSRDNKAEAAVSSALTRIFCKHELPAFVGVSRAALEEMIRNNEFPRPIRINDHGRILGWLESEIIEWQQRRKALRDSGRSPRHPYHPMPPRPKAVEKKDPNRGVAVRGK